MAAKLYQQSYPRCRRTDPVELPSRLWGRPMVRKARAYTSLNRGPRHKVHVMLYLVTAGAVVILNAALSRVVGPECEVHAMQHRL